MPSILWQWWPAIQTGEDMKSGWKLGCLSVALIVLAMCSPAQAADPQPKDGLKCADNEEREGNLCYPRCQDDGYTRYEGDGEECWQICPSNSQDHGNVCLMGPAQLKKKHFKRGPGRPIS